MGAAMGSLTAVLLAAFVAYTMAWYAGAVEGNFALLLMLATAVTGVYWVLEKLFFFPQRRRGAGRWVAEQERRAADWASKGLAPDRAETEETRQRLLQQPWWLDWTAGLFPVILAVFVLRSFLYEPFKIPSGSMIPTLHVGDLILVNKFHYGLRLPVFNTKLIDNHAPALGDVMVFRYPPQPSLDYIKRVVGLPGDEVSYLNKRLSVNGKPVLREDAPEFFDKDAMRYATQFSESIEGHRFNILIDENRPNFVAGTSDFPFRENCRYTVEGVTCTVPPGHYFLMGDNRDNSLDSRYWGFVPESHIVGKAFMVWMNFSDLSRIGRFQ